MTEKAYLRLYNILRERIIAKKYAVGSKLPSEPKLCLEFGLSRITCRHAIRLLQEQGLVEKFPGRGTFVKPIRQGKVPILVNAYSESIRKEAPNTTRKLAVLKELIPPGEVADILGLFKTETCIFAERIDYLDSEPLAFDNAYLPTVLTTKLSEDIFSRVDFLEIWLNRHSLEMSHIWNSIEAIRPSAEVRKKLNAPLNCPILKTTDVIYSIANKALAVFVTFYRGDRFRLISANTRK